jgi:hypothetical protein
MNADMRTSATIIISAEFVNEISCPNRLSEKIRWISNCSIGP